MSSSAPEILAWALAVEFLAEAERCPASVLPRMATHAAYYAMFHGARAVLLKIDGLNAPNKHSAVVGRFGYHAKQRGDPALMAAGRMLNEVQQERLRSDYDASRTPDPADAAFAVRSARNFLEICDQSFGFGPG